MYDGDPGEIDFGSSQREVRVREVRVREGSSYWTGGRSGWRRRVEVMFQVVM